MKSLITLATFITAFFFFNGTIDLDNLFNHADQTLPNYINRDNTPNNNRITNEGATLGRVLFYDKNLSANNSIACASCHKQEFAFSDDATQSVGLSGGLTGRHSMRLVNARFAEEVRFFWDERATSLEDQTTRPIQDHIEMGFSGSEGDPDLNDLINRLSQIEYYQQLFTEVYGDAQITEERMQLALAQFIRSIQSFDAKYDTGLAQARTPNSNFPNFTAEENQGKTIFMAPPNQGGAGCQGCHRAPTFDIDPNSRNNGVIGVAGDPAAVDLINTRAPSLRDLVNPNGVLNGPLMHDGSLTSLMDVVEHYNQITIDPRNNNLDRRLRGGGPGGGNGQNLNLTQAEKEALVAFLGTLTGSALYTDERWSDPFDVSGNLTIVNRTVVDNDNDGFSVEEDCNDNNAAINPNAAEILDNEIDENCDGIAAMSEAVDNDNDGFNEDEDCDDNNASINPGAAEILDNGIDENCDGIAAVTAEIDNDNDGFNENVDCNDNNAAIHPNATDIPDNGIDENCDGADAITELTNNCPVPSQIRINTIGNRRAAIEWASINTATYFVQIRIKGTTRWLLSTTTRRNSATITGPPNTYEFQIQTQCEGDVVSTFSPIQEFTIRRRNLSTDESRSRSAADNLVDIIIPKVDLISATAVFPNPVIDILNVAYETSENATLIIQHISGQVVLQQRLQMGTNIHHFDCSDFDAGIYILTIEQEGRAAVVQKFVKAVVE